MKSEMSKDFGLFARSHNVSSMTLHRFTNTINAFVNPTIVEERKMNVAIMDVFSRLMMDRIIYLGTVIDDDISNIVIAQMLFLASEKDEPIKLMINSPGGDVYSGLGIYDTMNLISPEVQTRCNGVAASMAAILLMNGEKGSRSAMKHSKIMLHQPLGSATGQASDIEITAREILKVKSELYECISECTGKDIEQVKLDCDRDLWLNSQEALEYGIIDNVFTKKV